MKDFALQNPICFTIIAVAIVWEVGYQIRYIVHETIGE